jgi:hypothetical protein
MHRLARSVRWSNAQPGRMYGFASANERLGKMQRIAATMIADSLPRNGAGKVVKPALRAAFLASPPRFGGGNPFADVRGE